MQFSNARYMLYLNDPNGNRISELNTADTNQFMRLKAVRTVNNVGAISITFTGGSQEPAFLPFLQRFGLLRKDCIIEVWRITSNIPSLLMNTVWYVRSVQQSLAANGVITIEVTAMDALYLLAGRLCMNTASLIQTQLLVSGAISQVMTTLVYQNTRSSALLGSGRRIPNLVVPIQSYNEPAADDVTIDVSKMNLLTALQALSDLSIQNGAPIYFDIECNSATSMMFNVYANQRGVDRRSFNTDGDGRSSIISTNSGIIREMNVTADWSEEITAVFPWGNNGSATVGFITDPINQISPYTTPFAWREAVSDSSNNNNADAEYAAYSLLQASRGTWNVSATLQDTSDFYYGRDWDFGDRIYLNAFGSILDTRINSLEVTVENKQESIRIALTVTEDML
jgi:hypothetical protein